MKIDPILPIWLMTILCIGMLLMKRKGLWNYIRQILIVLLLFAMNLRILVFAYDVPKTELNVDVLFVIDDTMSMLAEDFDDGGLRLDAVKDDREYIMDMMAGARFSVISFGNQAQKLMPFTSDASIVMTTIETLEGQTKYYANSTSLNLPFTVMRDTLERSYEEDRFRARVVFFMSDGEITEMNGKLGSYKEAEKFVSAGAVLGYGTTEGGRMQVRNFDGDTGARFYMQTRGKDGFLEDAISKIDEKNLNSIADDLDITYYHVVDDTVIRDVVDDINADLEDYSESEMSGTEGYSETYYYFAIPLVILLVYDLIYYKRRLKA